MGNSFDKFGLFFPGEGLGSSPDGTSPPATVAREAAAGLEFAPYVPQPALDLKTQVKEAFDRFSDPAGPEISIDILKDNIDLSAKKLAAMPISRDDGNAFDHAAMLSYLRMALLVAYLDGHKDFRDTHLKEIYQTFREWYQRLFVEYGDQVKALDKQFDQIEDDKDQNTLQLMCGYFSMNISGALSASDTDAYTHVDRDIRKKGFKNIAEKFNQTYDVTVSNVDASEKGRPSPMTGPMPPRGAMQPHASRAGGRNLTEAQTGRPITSTPPESLGSRVPPPMLSGAVVDAKANFDKLWDWHKSDDEPDKTAREISSRMADILKISTWNEFIDSARLQYETEKMPFPISGKSTEEIPGKALTEILTKFYDEETAKKQAKEYIGVSQFNASEDLNRIIARNEFAKNIKKAAEEKAKENNDELKKALPPAPTHPANLPNASTETPKVVKTKAESRGSRSGEGERARPRPTPPQPSATPAKPAAQPSQTPGAAGPPTPPGQAGQSGPPTPPAKPGAVGSPSNPQPAVGAAGAPAAQPRPPKPPSPPGQPGGRPSNLPAGATPALGGQPLPGVRQPGGNAGTSASSSEAGSAGSSPGGSPRGKTPPAPPTKPSYFEARSFIVHNHRFTVPPLVATKFANGAELNKISNQKIQLTDCELGSSKEEKIDLTISRGMKDGSISSTFTSENSDATLAKLEDEIWQAYTLPEQDFKTLVKHRKATLWVNDKGSPEKNRDAFETLIDGIAEKIEEESDPDKKQLYKKRFNEAAMNGHFAFQVKREGKLDAYSESQLLLQRFYYRVQRGRQASGLTASAQQPLPRPGRDGTGPSNPQGGSGDEYYHHYDSDFDDDDDYNFDSSGGPRNG